MSLAGEKSNGLLQLNMAKDLTTDVQRGVALNTGHWLPDEKVDQLSP